MIQNSGRQSGRSGFGFMLDRKRVRLGIPADDLQLIWKSPSPQICTPPRRHGVSVFPLYFADRLLGDVYIFINSGSFRYKSKFLCAAKVCVKIRCWFIGRFGGFVFIFVGDFGLTHICRGGTVTGLKTCILRGKNAVQVTGNMRILWRQAIIQRPSAVAISWMGCHGRTLARIEICQRDTHRPTCYLYEEIIVWLFHSKRW